MNSRPFQVYLPEQPAIVGRAMDGLNSATTPAVAMNALHRAVREMGFSDVSYLAGFAFENKDQPSGFAVQKILHYSTCPGDWLEALFAEHGPENDYDIQRFLMGHASPFVSGHNITELMGPVSTVQRRILELKAQAGFAANLIVPLPSTAYSLPSYAALMLISRMDRDAFSRAMATWYHALVGLAHLFHFRLGGDAHTVLERQEAVEVCVRAMNRTEEAAEDAEEEAPAGSLSTRQREVLRLVSLGRRTDQIADALDLSRVTVDRHLKAARAVLGAHTTAEAVAIAISRELVRPHH